MKTPKILISALRQYRHNTGSGFVAGFDHDETVKIFKELENPAHESVGLRELLAAKNILLAEKKKYHKEFMSREKVNLHEQLRHDEEMMHFEWTIEFIHKQYIKRCR